MENDFELRIKDGIINVSGAIYIHNIRDAARQLKNAAHKNKVIDLKNLTRLDSAGALLLSSLEADDIKLQNLAEEYKALFELVGNANKDSLQQVKKPPRIVQFINLVGKSSIEVLTDSHEIISFLGHAIIALAGAFIRPHKIRFGSIVHHIEAIGIRAIPIVSVMAFAIAVILAYQSVAQLRPLGAEQFTVNLLIVSILREMGVLLTAIMIAGRSGSAFTAEIGVMKLREEVDALRATGIEPFEMLVVPRLIAIIIALPLLTFIADAAGLLGGAVISSALIDISFKEYIGQIENIASVNMFFIGMVKAPVFALAIGIVGCMHGLKVTGSAESVGRETTASVVKSIFLVLILDALFSVLFVKLGI